MLTIKNSDIAKHLSLPPVKLHCSMLAEDAIKAAVRDIKARHAPLAVPPSLPTANLMSCACQELSLSAATLCCNKSMLLQEPGAKNKPKKMSLVNVLTRPLTVCRPSATRQSRHRLAQRRLRAQRPHEPCPKGARRRFKVRVFL